jgi:hypothetical protein
MTFPRCAATLTMLLLVPAASTAAYAADPCLAMGNMLQQRQAQLEQQQSNYVSDQKELARASQTWTPGPRKTELISAMNENINTDATQIAQLQEQIANLETMQVFACAIEQSPSTTTADTPAPPPPAPPPVTSADTPPADSYVPAAGGAAAAGLAAAGAALDVGVGIMNAPAGNDFDPSAPTTPANAASGANICNPTATQASPAPTPSAPASAPKTASPALVLRPRTAALPPSGPATPVQPAGTPSLPPRTSTNTESPALVLRPRTAALPPSGPATPVQPAGAPSLPPRTSTNTDHPAGTPPAPTNSTNAHPGDERGSAGSQQGSSGAPTGQRHASSTPATKQTEVTRQVAPHDFGNTRRGR